MAKVKIEGTILKIDAVEVDSDTMDWIEQTLKMLNIGQALTITRVE